MNENSKTLPNMSLTAFKALVGQQPVYVELVERYGARGDKIPEKLRGKRASSKPVPTALILQSLAACTRRLVWTFRRAFALQNRRRLSDAFRPPANVPSTQRKRAKMDDWRAIQNSHEFQRRSDIDALTDGSSTYWQEKRFFDGDMSYLFSGTKCGKSLVYAKDDTPRIRDERIPGNKILKYRIIVAGAESAPIREEGHTV